ncbi:MAG: glycosyltransferase family 4 protein [Veillonellales bacterium]
MRIIHIEDFFHPNAGYQVNILSKYQAKLGHEVYVVTSEFKKMPNELKYFFGNNSIETLDNEFDKKYNVKIIRVPLVTYISGRSIYANKIFKIVDELRPDILYVHGSDTYIGIRYILRANYLNYPIISDNHMAKMASRNKFRNIFYYFYKKYVSPGIVRNDIKIIKMSNDDYVYRCLGVPQTQTPVIGFGSDLMLFHPDIKTKVAMRDSLNIPQDSFVIVYAGKLNESKGAKFYAEAIKDKITTSKNLIFLIVGNLVGEYGAMLVDLYNTSKNVIIIEPTQKYTDLAKYYQMADIAVFPRQCSLSFFDVQACGLPVLLETNEINCERVKYGNGMLFRSNDISDLREKIYKCINMPETELNVMKNYAISYIKQNYDYENICQRYMEIINSVCKINNSML